MYLGATRRFPAEFFDEKRRKFKVLQALANAFGIEFHESVWEKFKQEQQGFECD